MGRVATLTLNPTLDVSFEVASVVPTHKMRGGDEQHDPGGGGINVGRVFVRLGGDARCYYLSGGSVGAALDRLLDLHQLVHTKIPIGGETRVSTSVLERDTAREYRFVTAGPVVAADEWHACEAHLANAKCEYLVASGSLPRGVPEDAYARIAAIAKRNGIRFVLDSSGVGLARGLVGGGVFLVKPSIGELRTLSGHELDTEEAVVHAARDIVERGQAEHVAVTMGRDGALLVNASGDLRLPAIQVETSSTVGAGDSFLAAMIYGFAHGRSPSAAFRLGMAAGAAAALTPGTNLAQADDIWRLDALAAGGPDRLPNADG